MAASDDDARGDELDALPVVPYADAFKAGPVRGNIIEHHAPAIIETEVNWLGYRLPPMPR